MTDYSINPREMKITYIGGGSRGWAWKLMSDLATTPDIGGRVTLYDIDFAAAETNVAIGNRMNEIPEARSHFHYVMSTDLREALAGADFVVISILPGSFDEMQSDVHAPEAYGIYQSVGDTTGPGGILRALRTLPMYIPIAQAIRDVCPEAWVINYTNPMSACVGMLYRVFPQIKAFGCCHEVFNTQTVIAGLVKDEFGIGDIERGEIKVNVQGINHFTWLTSARYQGTDVWPVYERAARRYVQEGYSPVAHFGDQSSFFKYANCVKFDLFNRYGCIAAAGDRHLAEFCPPWYLKDPETVARWKFSLTPVSYRRERQAELIAQSRRMACGEQPVEITVSGEEGVRQMKALMGLGDFMTNVNLPNHGQISNLPLDTTVETNAFFSRNSIRPVAAGSMEKWPLTLTMPHVHLQDCVLEACEKRALKPAFDAFVANPLVTCSLDDARRLFGRMVDDTAAYLDHYEDRAY